MKFRALLLALTLVLTVSGTAGAAVTEHRESTTNLSIAYPILSAEDGVAADPINADIAALAASVRTQYDSGAFYRGEFGYRVHLDDDNFLSVTFTDLSCVQISRHVMTTAMSTTRRRDSVCRSRSSSTSRHPISTVRRSVVISTTSRDATRQSSQRSPYAKYRQTTSSADAAMCAPSFRRAS